MATERAPAFQFYPKDFISDLKVMHMSLTERGLYITLLSICWVEGSLPGSTKTLAKLVHLPVGRFERLWAGPLGSCFRLDPVGNYTHKRLDAEREKQATFRRRQSDKAQRGAETRRKRSQLLSNPNESRMIHPAVPDDRSSIFYLPSSKEQEHVHDRPSPSARPSPAPPVPPPPPAPSLRSGRDGSPLFAEFWTAYPRKTAKGAALKAWQALKPDRPLVDAMLAALTWQSTQVAWTKDAGAFVPFPATWLRAQRWQDEPDGPRSTRPTRPPRCRHEPACVDEAAHTTRDLADRRAQAS